MDKKASRVIVRKGFSTQPVNLKSAEFGYFSDTRVVLVGDEGGAPPQMMTTKSKGIFDFTSTDKIIFKNLDLIGNLNGKSIEDIIDKVDSGFNSDTNIFYRQLPRGTSIVVRSATTVEPPSAPSIRDVYLIPSGGTDAWAGKGGQLTQKSGTEWIFVSPTIGTVIGVADNGSALKFTSSGWVPYYSTIQEHLDHSVNDRPATPAGVYAMLEEFSNGGSGGGGIIGNSIKHTVSANPPASPSLGDQWRNTNNEILYSWSYDGAIYEWLPISNEDETVSLDKSNSDYTLPITWYYSDSQRYSFETFSDDIRYNWRDFGTSTVTNGVAGDDTLDLDSTSGLVAGQSYVLVKKDGKTLQTVDIVSVLTDKRVRVRNDLGSTIVSTDGVKISRNSFNIGENYAIVENGDVFFTRIINVMNVDPLSRGSLVIRRTALGLGTFTVSFRPVGTTDWTVLDLENIRLVNENFRDEYYAIPSGGRLQYRIVYNADAGVTDTLTHMVIFLKPQAVDANRVLKPSNVAPSDQAVGVSLTPTLTGSAYRSIYGLPQIGAEFQISVDPKFKNVLYSSSTDFLSSWVRITGATAASKALAFITNTRVIVVGDAGSIRSSTDSGNTYTNLTSAISQDLTAIATNGSRIIVVGNAGAIQYSDDLGTTFSALTQANSYAGKFNGVKYLPGNYVIAVGDSGEIERSVNNGIIWAKISPDNGYSGSFKAVATDAKGNVIIVGANGEIQTSGNRGQSFVRRTNAGNYSGTFNAVDMDDDGNAIAVGATGEIQISADYGATWSKVPAANSYTGTFYGVDLYMGYALAVGTNGEIQSSKNNGQLWVKRTAANSETGTFRASAITPGNYALIVGDGGITQKPVLVGASTVHTVPAGSDFLQSLKVYYWRHRYQDSAGFWSEFSSPTIFATVNTAGGAPPPAQTDLNAVKQPMNVSPADNATNVDIASISLQSTAFSFTGANDTHAASQWQVFAATDTALATPLNANANTDNTTSLINITLSLPNAGSYQWRVRHKGANNGYSPWSLPTKFTAKKYLVKPVLGVTDDVRSSSNKASVNASSSVYLLNMGYVYTNVAAGGSFNLKTYYEVFSDAALTKFVAGGLTDFANSFNISPSTLLPNKTYFARAQMRDTDITSMYSDILVFNTNATSSIGEAIFDSPGSYIFTVPDGVTSICAVVVGGGGGPFASGPNVAGYGPERRLGGCGGGLTWKNNIAVTPGARIPITVGAGGGLDRSGGTSSFSNLFSATGGSFTAPDYQGYQRAVVGKGGTSLGGDGGGNGGEGTQPEYFPGCGGGAGGYTGNGGSAINGDGYGTPEYNQGKNGTGGGGGGGTISYQGDRLIAGAGGGVGLYGQGANGVGGGKNVVFNGTVYTVTDGQGGSGGQFGGEYSDPTKFSNRTFNGGKYGGGAAHIQGTSQAVGGSQIPAAGTGASGAVRIIWGGNRSFPSNAA